MPWRQNKLDKKTVANEAVDILNFQETLELIHKLHVHQAELEAAKNESEIRRDVENLRPDYAAELFDVTPIGLLIVDNKWTIQKANSAAAEMLGLGKDSCISTSFTAFLDTESVELFFDNYRKLVITGSPQTTKLTVKRGEANFSAECELSSIDNSTTDFRIVLTDMDERKGAITELKKKHPNSVILPV